MIVILSDIIMAGEIVICVYEHTTWHIWHKISNISRTREYYYKNGIPMVDGERLFILLLSTAGDVGEIYMHNILTKSWEKNKDVVMDIRWRLRLYPFCSNIGKALLEFVSA